MNKTVVKVLLIIALVIIALFLLSYLYIKLNENPNSMTKEMNIKRYYDIIQITQSSVNSKGDSFLLVDKNGMVLETKSVSWNLTEQQAESLYQKYLKQDDMFGYNVKKIGNTISVANGMNNGKHYDEVIKLLTIPKEGVTYTVIHF